MSKNKQIDSYMARLQRAMAGVRDMDRADIMAEIRAHLDTRADQGRLDEAITELGSPEACASAFLDELRLQAAFSDGGPAKTLSTLIAMASRRTLAATGLFVSGIFFLLAIGFVITALAEIVSPEMAGLWINDGHDSFSVVIGVMDDKGAVRSGEILGRWLIPVAMALAVLSLILGQKIGRVFLKMLMQKKPTIV